MKGGTDHFARDAMLSVNVGRHEKHEQRLRKEETHNEGESGLAADVTKTVWEDEVNEEDDEEEEERHEKRNDEDEKLRFIISKLKHEKVTRFSRRTHRLRTITCYTRSHCDVISTLLDVIADVVQLVVVVVDDDAVVWKHRVVTPLEGVGWT